MKNILKIILVGIATTVCRIIGQFLIPAGEQSVLEPSVFANNGTMHFVFTVYGIFAYSLIASMFLFIRNQLTGNRVWQGLRYAISCCAVWVIYLLEPLPHVAPLDRITYPIADGVALLVMGTMLGFLFGETKPYIVKKAKRDDIIPLAVIAACFVIGRLVQYFVFDIYSSFDSKRLETIIWVILTGFVVACVMVWLNRYVEQKCRIARAFILGGLLFGLDLTLFNFFMPLVFKADMPDLILRTSIDISAVMLGCLSLKRNKYDQLIPKKVRQ